MGTTQLNAIKPSLGAAFEIQTVQIPCPTLFDQGDKFHLSDELYAYHHTDDV